MPLRGRIQNSWQVAFRQRSLVGRRVNPWLDRRQAPLSPPDRGEGALLSARRILAALVRPRDRSLLLERPHVSDKALDLVVGQAFGRLHDLLAVLSCSLP